MQSFFYTLKYGEALAISLIISVVVLTASELTGQTNPGLKSDPVDRTIQTVIQRSRAAKTADEGLAIINGLKTDTKYSTQQSELIETELKKWKVRVDQGLVRNGSEWVSKEDYAAKVKEADHLVEKAALMIETKDYKAAREALEMASRIDGNGIRPDFILGLLNTPAIANFPEFAEQHFRRVLMRSPNHLPALNNVALSCVRQKEFSQAYEFWRKMSEIAPNTPELLHNIGRLLDEDGKGKLRVGGADKKRFQNLYLKIVTAENAGARYQSGGWRYMMLSVAANEAERIDPKEKSSLLATSQGSGFVVAPGVVLTNRHVVSDSSAVRIEIEDRDSRKQLDAKVLSVSPTHDLALIECKELKAPAAPFSTQSLRRGSEIIILGFPEAQKLGRTLKATRGSITGLPSSEYENMVMFDATANHGNSGGPVADQFGNVLAVLTVGFRVEGQLTGGVTAENASKFVLECIPDFKSVPRVAKLEWPDVDAEIAKSTVMVLTYQQLVAVKGTQGSKPNSTFIEDNSCSFCGGKRLVQCPAKGCSNGAIVVKERVAAGKSSITGATLYKVVNSKVDCGHCNGDGKVSCPACR